MLAELIDYRLLRLALGALVGFPLSIIAVFAAPQGLVLGYWGIVEGNLLSAFLGLMTMLGVVSIFGAWYRLLVPHANMAAIQARRVRFCLYCGVISSLGLAALAGHDALFGLSAAVSLLGIAGVILILGTPVPKALYPISQVDPPTAGGLPRS